MSYFIGFITWLKANYTWVLILVEAVIVFLVTRAYYKAYYYNKNLKERIQALENQIKEENRINTATHKFQESIDDDNPSKITNTDFPKKFTICIALLFMIGCTGRPAMIKPELPRLRIYMARHISVDYALKDDHYYTPKSNYYSIVFNEAEYKRVIASYEKQVRLYNDFLREYYNDDKKSN